MWGGSVGSKVWAEECGERSVGSGVWAAECGGVHGTIRECTRTTLSVVVCKHHRISKQPSCISTTARGPREPFYSIFFSYIRYLIYPLSHIFSTLYLIYPLLNIHYHIFSNSYPLSHISSISYILYRIGYHIFSISYIIDLIYHLSHISSISYIIYIIHD